MSDHNIESTSQISRERVQLSVEFIEGIKCFKQLAEEWFLKMKFEE